MAGNIGLVFQKEGELENAKEFVSVRIGYPAHEVEGTPRAHDEVRGTCCQLFVDGV